MDALVKAPLTTTESTQPRRKDEITSSQSSKINPSGYFALDNQEIMSMFGPAITDVEVSSLASRFLESDNAGKYDRVKPTLKLPENGSSIDKSGYFAYEDADATHEVLGLLGPALIDGEVSHYIAHFLA